MKLTHSNYEYMARKIVQYIGGKENIVSNENCMTRIRLELKDPSRIDEEKIKQTWPTVQLKSMTVWRKLSSAPKSQR